MIKIKGYSVANKVGTGGMADVYKAISISDNRDVAIKVLKSESIYNNDMVKRFLREGSILSKLSHPNIVKYIDSGKFNEVYYIITEFLENGNILSTVNYDFEFKISVAFDLCDALFFAHRANVVHRDLKPSNILMNSINTPKITDFGIASLLNSDWTQLTKTDMVIGTIAYMSPEQQFRPHHVNHRTDIYSMGAILYQYFTGREAVGRFPLPTELIPSFPKKLEQVILKCMDYDPAQRFATAGEIAESLYPFLGEKIELPPVTLFGEEKETVSIKDDFSDRITPGLQALKSKYVQEQLDGELKLKNSLKKEDIPRLYSVLKTEDNRVRWVLLDIIGELGDESAVSHIINFINIHQLTPYVIKALGKIKGQKSLNILIDLMPKKALLRYKETDLSREFLPQIIESIAEISPFLLLKYEGYLLFHKSYKVRLSFLKLVLEKDLVIDVKNLEKLLKSEKNKSIIQLVKKIKP